MGAQAILGAIRKRWPWLKHLFADGAYDRGKLMSKAAFLDFVVEIVRRINQEPGFKVLPRRWVVEIVFTQVTKADVLALGAGGQHIADLDLGIGDDHAVDEQQHELPALLEGRRGQPALHPRAECLQ